MKLIATKSYSYATRRLKAGDEFDATNMHARILVGARKARYAADQGKPEPQPVIVPEEKAEASAEARVTEREPEAEDEGAKAIDRLRAEAEKLGISVDGRWGVARLQHEITQARRR